MIRVAVRRTRPHLLAVLAALAAIGSSTSPTKDARAQSTPSNANAVTSTAEDAEAVEAGRSALRSSSNYPWYDSEKDDLSRIELPKEKTPPANTTAPTNVDWGFPEWLATSFAYVFQLGFYLLAAAILVLIIILLVRAFLNREAGRSVAGNADDDEDVEGEVDRMEALPFAVARPRGDLLSEARRLYEAGDFAQAIIYLFSYQLVTLDRHQAIQLVRGKTNRQYLLELRAHRQLSALVTNTMLTFEDVFFGHYPLERRQFESCWNQLDEFHQILQKAGTA